VAEWQRQHVSDSTSASGTSPQRTPWLSSPLEVFLVALRLGVTSFGGPIAHIGYFRAEYVDRRRWVDEHTFADLVGLCQFLPGPASSQLGIAIGIQRRGLVGGVLAWLGFTLPSAVLLVLFAYGVDDIGSSADGWVHGLKVVAVAVVALAVWSMARSLAWDLPRGAIAVAGAAVMLAWDAAAAQILVIAAGGLVGWVLFRRTPPPPKLDLVVPVSRRASAIALVMFVGLLAVLPIAKATTDDQSVAMADTFYRSGSLVFGGGHVVLPLLEKGVVDPGWLPEEDFLAGYGAAQAVPGPLFTFSAYLGAAVEPEPNGVPGASLALVAIFVPAFLLIMGVLPLWEAIRTRPVARAVMRGVNAAVVGILLAALWRPVVTSAVDDGFDVALALAALAALAWLKLPPWMVVVLTAAGGALVAQL
jgi:chromate transporter